MPISEAGVSATVSAMGCVDAGASHCLSGDWPSHIRSPQRVDMDQGHHSTLHMMRGLSIGAPSFASPFLDQMPIQAGNQGLYAPSSSCPQPPRAPYSIPSHPAFPPRAPATYHKNRHGGQKVRAPPPKDHEVQPATAAGPSVAHAPQLQMYELAGPGVPEVLVICKPPFFYDPISAARAAGASRLGQAVRGE